MDAASWRCECGARLVGEPILEPPNPEPALGLALASALLAVLSLASFWMKPFLLLAVLAGWFGWRAVRSTRLDPLRYGGRRTALVSLGCAMALLVGVSAWMIAGIPRALRNLRESKTAATRAEMYHVAGLVQDYHNAYGVYPDRLSDLARMESIRATPESHDSWEHRIVYAGFTSGVASASGGGLPLNANFELRSFGPDGEPNTADDVVMRDGAFVDARTSGDPSPTIPVSVPVSKRGVR